MSIYRLDTVNWVTKFRRRSEKGAPPERRARMPLFLARFLLTYWTMRLSVIEPPPVVVVMTTGYVPAGVPGFLVELLLLLHEASHRVEKASTTIRLRKRMPRAARLREPAVKTIPSNPGSRAAKNMRWPLPRGRRSCAVGATVGIFTLTEAASVGVEGVTVHGAAPDAIRAAGAVHIKVSSVTPDGLTLMVAVPACPGFTWSVLELTVRVTVGVVVAFQAVKSALASTEPRPVTRL